MLCVIIGLAVSGVILLGFAIWYATTGGARSERSDNDSGW